MNDDSEFYEWLKNPKNGLTPGMADSGDDFVIVWRAARRKALAEAVDICFAWHDKVGKYPRRTDYHAGQMLGSAKCGAAINRLRDGNK
jgi:hypothetical protein